MRNYYSKWQSMAFFCLLIIAAVGSVRAQVSGYTFSQRNQTYTPITGGTLLFSGTTDDAISPSTAIGFSFVYNTVAYTTIKVNSNGWASFGTTTTGALYTPLSTTGTHHPCLAPLGRDLQGNTNGSIRLETIGTAPNRVCVIQWNDYRRFAGAGQSFNFQIRLYETTNVVEYVYGTMTASASNADYDCGLTGTTNTDFNIRTTGTDWNATTAAAANTANMTLAPAIFPISGLSYDWGAEIVPSPTQAAGIPTCLTGSDLTVTGTPAANTTWYWQTTADGISTANNASTPWTVFANGTYYVRAFNSFYQTWSPVSSSVTVSNFPVAPTPPAPIAAVNPSCAPTGTTLSVDAAPVGTDYYWQGTTANGTSTANPATATFAATATGTYHVSAFETASGCWSNSSSVSVTVDNVIPPSPVVAQSDFNYCAGVLTAPVSADVPVQIVNATCAATATGSGSEIPGLSVLVNNFSCATGTVTGATLTYTFNTPCTWTLTNVVVNGNTILTGVCAQTNLDLTPYLPLTSVQVFAYDNPSDGFDDFPSVNVTVNLTYSGPAVPQPSYVLNWYDAATAGNTLGTGSPLETVGTSVMPTATGGSYNFYVETVLGGCSSAAREEVTVNISTVNAVLTPVNVTCNGGNNGSFTLGAIECGTTPFTYSVNGGAFGSIPTDLTAGTYSVIIQDNVGLESAPIAVQVTQPDAPSNITFANVNYFTADVSWTTTGDETSWTVEYGSAGFAPGSGTTVNATSTTVTLTGLTEDTQYDVYVTADCAPNPETAGPATFSTNSGFFTWDNNCGPGFNDISGTGASQDLGDDNQFDFTLPWTWDYQGLSITTLSVDNNGGISFVAGAGVPFTNGQMNAAANGLYPMWDDLFSNGGAVYTEVIGTAPNRQAIIQWNVDHIGYDGTDFIFQVVIDEATSEVYYLYENVVLGSATYDYGATATVGAAGPQTDVQVSFNSPTFLQNNSCVHLYYALCPNPTNVVVTEFQEDIILDWTPSAYGETEWTIIYGPTGFDPATEGTTLTGIVTSDATISGLTQLTDYDIYIYSECAADNLTSGGLLVEATTLPWCADPTVLGGTTVVDSLFATWNWTAAPAAPNALSAFNLSYGPFGTTDAYAGTELVANGLDYADTIADPNFLGSGVYQVWVQAICGVDSSNYVGPFTFVMPLSNDTVCGAEMLNVDGTVYYFNNIGATVDADEPSIMPLAPGLEGYNGTDLPMMTWGEGFPDGTTWYSFIAPASGSIRFSGEDQDYFASQIAIYESADCGDYATFELVAASDQTDPTITTKVAPNFTICGLTPGNVYYVMHESWNGLFDQYSIKLSPINLEAGSFADVLDVCTGSEVNLFDGITGYDNGGIWTAEIAAAGTGITDSTFNSSGLAYQVFNFEYRVTDGCAYDSIVSQVEIWAPSSAGDDGSITVCRNEPFDLLSGLGGTVDMGGTWYDPGNTALPSSAITASNIPGQFNYDYVVGNGICPNDTALVLVNVSSSCNYLNVEDMVFSEMTVYPNPSNGVFSISNGGTDVFSVEVTDIEGRVIFAKEAAVNGTTVAEIDLTGKVTGVYMIRVYNDNAEKVFRVVLQ
jgi:hypothetical protein